MQLGFIRADAGVAANEVQLADWNVEGGLVRVFQMQKFLQQGVTVLVNALA